jgi:hypothetical protein
MDLCVTARLSTSALFVTYEINTNVKAPNYVTNTWLMYEEMYKINIFLKLIFILPVTFFR